MQRVEVGELAFEPPVGTAHAAAPERAAPRSNRSKWSGETAAARP